MNFSTVSNFRYDTDMNFSTISNFRYDTDMNCLQYQTSDMIPTKNTFFPPQPIPIPIGVKIAKIYQIFDRNLIFFAIFGKFLAFFGSFLGIFSKKIIIIKYQIYDMIPIVKNMLVPQLIPIPEEKIGYVPN